MAGNEGFEEFAAANLPRLLRFGLLLTGDPHQAEELVQAGLVRTLGAWKRVDQRQNPLGYVQQTMARLNVDAWRRLVRRPTPLHTRHEGNDHAPSADNRIDAVVLLAGLPPRQRAVLVLRYYEDLTEEQTARALGCSVGTVKSQSHKALRALRAQLHDHNSTGARA